MDETLCKKCGKCCYKKIAVGDRVQITPFPCEFLDVDTNLCTIYPSRFEKDPECLSVADGMRISAFPADCGYVPQFAPPDYEPALEGWCWDHRWHEFEDLADLLDVSPKIRAQVRARGPD